MRYLLSLSLILLASMGWAKSSVDVSIVVKPEATVESGRVYLGDIAMITTADTELQMRLKKVQVARAPLPGLSRHLKSKVVQNVVLSKIPLLQHITWRGAEETNVTSLRVVVELSDINKSVEAQLIQKLQLHYGDNTKVQIESVDSQQIILLPTNIYHVVTRVSSANLGNQRVCVFADIVIDKHIYKSLPLWFAVTATRPVPVLTRAINIREPVKAHDFQTQSRNIAGINNIASIINIQSKLWRASTNLSAGNILREGQIEPQPAVMASKPVDVSVKTQRVHINTIGYAVEDGRMGESIKIRNPNSEGIFVATVVGQGQVEVNLR